MVGWLPGMMFLAVLLVGCTDKPRAVDALVVGTPAPTADVARIEGVLRDRGRPVAGATVTLIVYADDACADLASAGASTPAEDVLLAGCAQDVGEAPTDATGSFRFDDLLPGVYRVALSWELDLGVNVGLGSATMQQVGGWMIRYGHARTVDGRSVDFAYAHTAALRVAAGDVLPLDLAHVPPR